MSLIDGYLKALLAVFTLGVPGLLLASEAKLDISLEPPGNFEIASGSNAWKLYLDGVIESGADERVSKAIEHTPDNALIYVYLNSPGGDFLTGIKLGRLLRSKNTFSNIGKRNTKTDSHDPGVCYSACAMAFLGGTYRFNYGNKSKYGVHRTWRDGKSTDEDLDIGQIISAAVSTYIREMGVDGALLDLIVRAGKDELYYLSETEQRALRVTNEGRLPAEWSFQLNNGLHYLRGAQITMYGQSKFILLCDAGILELYSIYQTSSDKSRSIAGGGWTHLLSVDMKPYALGAAREIWDDDGFINSVFRLSPQHLNAILAARQDLGHQMLMAPDAPIYIGYRVDIESSSINKIKEFILACNAKTPSN